MTEDIPTPNPHPARGIYGFVLYVASWIFVVFYLAWLFVPDQILKEAGLSYLPAKYWAVSIPLLFPISVTSYVIFVFAYNCIALDGIFENVEVVKNDFKDD